MKFGLNLLDETLDGLVKFSFALMSGSILLFMSFEWCGGGLVGGGGWVGGKH